jgi:hypothetical protein
MDILIYIILWIVFSFIVGSLGKNKNIGFGYAFIISLLFSPLIGLIFVLFSANKINLTDLKIAHEAGVINDEEYKEKIRKVIPTQQDKEDTKKGYIVVGVIIIIMLIIWQIVKLF